MVTDDVIALLEELAGLLELSGAPAVQVRAYRNASQQLDMLEDDAFAALLQKRRLPTISGIGPVIAGHIYAFAKHGNLPFYDQLVASTPAGMVEMLHLKGMTPKLIRYLHKHLDIDTIGELEYACHEHRLSTTPGFGEKRQQAILAAIRSYKKTLGHYLYPHARGQAESLAEIIEDIPEVIRVRVVGSLRRGCEVVLDADLLVTTRDIDAARREIKRCPHFKYLQEQGPFRLLGTSRSGMPVEVFLCQPHNEASALLQVTGSGEFVGRLYDFARHKGIDLSYQGAVERKTGAMIPLDGEDDIFNLLGLPPIAPEQREQTEILEQVRRKKPAPLINEKDIRGVLHVHTTWSDGSGELEAMVTTARRLGLSYIGISDHSQSAYYARGLKPQQLLDQGQDISALQKKHRAIHILRGTESDILTDGALDYPDDILATLDYAIASVHVPLQLDEDAMTRRVITAIANPYTRMLAHPTGRLLLARQGYPINIPEVLEACARHDVAIEINSHPQRLDLDWRWGSLVRELKVPVVINPDAHSVRALSFYQYGVMVARKMGLSPRQVINTWPLEELQSWLQRLTDHRK